MSPAEKQAREEQADRKMRAAAEKTYNKEMPEPDTTFAKLKGQSIMDSVRKYSPNQAAEVDEGDANTKRYGETASKNFTEGKYGSAALNAAKGLGSAADTMLLKAPKAAAFAVRNRVVDGAKKASGGMVSSASKRADGCATKGKTRGKFI
mgnify:CR=1 FL=1|tara:strand:+ start:553 stop:1002 length:450 start_codon:yes stop_codon:yes gene_type:complete